MTPVEPRLRFTAWLDARERAELDRVAGELGVSRNYVMRLALRVGLGLSIPPALAGAISQPQAKGET
jgi:hypothetical protein